MVSESQLARARYRTESGMVARCVVRRATGGWVRNPETKQDEPATAEVYSGPCKVSFASAVERAIDVAGQRLTEQNPTLELPIATSAAVRTDDVAEITENPHDAALIGVRLRVAGLHAETTATSRKFPTEVV